MINCSTAVSPSFCTRKAILAMSLAIVVDMVLIACQAFFGYGTYYICHFELTAILMQKYLIRATVWDPTCTCPVVCTGSSCLYIWTPGIAYSVSSRPNHNLAYLI
ncbi:hypothetical protein ACFX2J_013274 [Malus domestica]